MCIAVFGVALQYMKVVKKYSNNEAKHIEDALKGFLLTKCGSRVAVGVVAMDTRGKKIKLYVGVQSNWSKHKYLSLSREFYDLNEANEWAKRVTDRIDTYLAALKVV